MYEVLLVTAQIRPFHSGFKSKGKWHVVANNAYSPIEGGDRKAVDNFTPLSDDFRYRKPEDPLICGTCIIQLKQKPHLAMIFLQEI